MTLRGNEAETFLLSRGRLTFGIGGGSGIGGGAKEGRDREGVGRGECA